MSVRHFIFRDSHDNHHATGWGNKSLAVSGDITVRDSGSGVIVNIRGKKKPLALDYSQLADLLRCARVLDYELKLSNCSGLDGSAMYVLVEPGV